MDYHGIKKIISGGQVGVDQGGLLAARLHGIETGGWAPRGYRTSTGPNLSLKTVYGLQEHQSAKYPPRTESNVISSDGTLIIASDFSSSGTALTIRFCEKHKRPYYEFGLPNKETIVSGDYDQKARITSLYFWLKNYSVEVLNVAGNHENSKFHEAKTVQILSDLFNLIEVEHW